MAMITPYRFARDINGYADISCLPPSNLSYTFGLAANAEQHFTTPKEASKYVIVFHYPDGALIWIGVGSTAVIPATPSVTIGNTILRPERLEVNKNTLISLLTGAANRISLQIFAEKNY